MRLLALRELGVPEVEISIVHPKSEAEKIKYNLSDNDRAGEYDDQALAELVYPYQEEIQLEDFKVDLKEPVNIREVIESFAPAGIDDQGKLDQISEKEAIQCPNCGHEFVA